MIERSWSCSMPNLGTTILTIFFLTILANKKEKWWSQWIFIKICGDDFMETFPKCRRHRWRRWSPRVSAQSRSKAFSEKPEQPRSSWLRWVAILVCDKVILDWVIGKLGARCLPVELGPFFLSKVNAKHHTSELDFKYFRQYGKLSSPTTHIKMQDSAIRKDI